LPNHVKSLKFELLIDEWCVTSIDTFKIQSIIGKSSYMDKKTFDVGKDDISVLNLTYVDIDFIMCVIGSISESPLSINFRIMPDQSALRLSFDGFTSGGCKYVSYTLGCYESIKYCGYGSTVAYANYWNVRQKWSISDVRVYELCESGPISLQYQKRFVRVEDPRDSIPDFANFYLYLIESFNHAHTWISQKLAMFVKCECGHHGTISDDAVSTLLKKAASVDNVVSRLKCNSCGKKRIIDIIPVYSKNTLKKFTHKTAWVPFRKSVPRRSAVHRNPELERMYEDLGGNGTDPVYLGDGAYLSSSGEVSDD
jgi:hypothetical protein